jgi:peptide/nickel transport system permease protein
MRRPVESSWSQMWRRFRRSGFAYAALVYVVLVAIVAVMAPLIANSKPLVMRTPSGVIFPAFHDLFGARKGVDELPAGEAIVGAPIRFSPNDIDVANRLRPPTHEHRFGTDDVGRDVLARIIHGARISLTVGLVAAGISLLVGSLLGAIAGYYGGATDWIVSRIIEVVLCFPFLFLVLGIIALFRASTASIIVALGLTTWTDEARFVRGEILRIRDLEFAHAARAIGARDARIIFRHLLPNALAPALVSANFAVATAILTESALSFLGLGVPLPAPSWGGMLSVAEQFIDVAWWLALFPGIAIFGTVAAFNIVGDRFRESLDPRAE